MANNDDKLSLTTVLIIDKKVASFPDLECLILQKYAPKGAFSIQENHVYSHYGFMCKQEAKRDKQTKIPVRMRLGSLDAVNSKEYGN